MNKSNAHKQSNNWWLDLMLFLCFLVAFMLDLTGVDIHQWLGMILFAFVFLHMARHFSWINCVFDNFFGKTSNRARGYALIDLLLLLAFLTITFTGLVISTWVNLYFTNYDPWLKVHIVSSISALGLLVLKVALHWRWIVHQAARIFKPAGVNQGVVIPEATKAAVSRRRFLSTMGLVGVSSFLAVSNVLPSLKQLVFEEEGTASNPTQKANTTVVEAQPTQAAPVSATQEQPTATTIPQVTDIPTAQPTQAFVACSYGCRKGFHCAYPGRCRDYRDTNGNGLCDLGECI